MSWIESCGVNLWRCIRELSRLDPEERHTMVLSALPRRVPGHEIRKT